MPLASNIGSFYGNATVNNTGHIEAYSLTDDAVGVSVLSVYGDAVVDNSGSIAAGGYGLAYGVVAYSVFGTASVTNSGSITATSTLFDTAMGVAASG